MPVRRSTEPAPRGSARAARWVVGAAHAKAYAVHAKARARDAPRSARAASASGACEKAGGRAGGRTGSAAGVSRRQGRVAWSRQIRIHPSPNRHCITPPTPVKDASATATQLSFGPMGDELWVQWSVHPYVQYANYENDQPLLRRQDGVRRDRARGHVPAGGGSKRRSTARSPATAGRRCACDVDSDSHARSWRNRGSSQV